MASSNGAKQVDGELVDDEITEVSPVQALAMLSTAEVDIQVATAKRYPRSLAKFREDAIALATADEETASSMNYALRKGGKLIEGPSVRAAEICAYAWGNLHGGSRIKDVGDKFVTAEAVLWDLEKNNRFAFENKRRITNGKGERYNDDMIGTTQLAATSIAFRTVVFKIIPAVMVKVVCDAAKKASVGTESIEQRVKRALEYFGKLGATPENVLKLLGRTDINAITPDDLITLQGFRTSIKDGDTTLANLLRETDEATQKTATVATPKAFTAESMLKGKVTAENDAKADDRPRGEPAKAEPAGVESDGDSPVGF